MPAAWRNVCGYPKAMSRAGAPAFQSRKKKSEYSLQLTEKQKIKGYYGIMERQLQGYFAKAQRKAGRTGDALFEMLECRLDNFQGVLTRLPLRGEVPVEVDDNLVVEFYSR